MSKDLQLSRISAGVMKWGSWGAQLGPTPMARLIEGCVEIGVSTFDHADIYGGYTTETDWGKGYVETKIDREQIKIVSKCGIMMPCEERPQYKVKHYDYSRRHIIDSVDRSLANLQCDYIDVLLLHRPSPLMDRDEIAIAVAQLKDSGKVRHFGVSNFNASQMSLIQSVESIEVNQIEISAVESTPMHDGTLDHMIQHDILPMAWSPLGGGAVFGPLSKPKDLDRRERLRKVADKYQLELDQLMYAYLLGHPSGIIPVTGSSKLDRIAKANACLDLPVSPDMWFEIWSAAMGHEVP